MRHRRKDPWNNISDLARETLRDEERRRRGGGKKNKREKEEGGGTRRYVATGFLNRVNTPDHSNFNARPVRKSFLCRACNLACLSTWKLERDVAQATIYSNTLNVYRSRDWSLWLINGIIFVDRSSRTDGLEFINRKSSSRVNPTYGTSSGQLRSFVVQFVLQISFRLNE